MSAPPEESGEYEVVVHRATDAQVWLERLGALGRAVERGGRLAGHGGRLAGFGGRWAGREGVAGLIRLRAYLATPEGRHAARRTVKTVAVVAALVGGFVMVRDWLESARRGMAAAAGAMRSAFGAMGAAARAARFVLPLRALTRLLRWSSLTGTAPRHRPCSECHARIRTDAKVCYRCGHRFGSSRVGGAGHGPGRPSRGRVRTGLTGVRWLWRVLALRLYRGCPDCRRLVHADARVCWHCGHRLRG